MPYISTHNPMRFTLRASLVRSLVGSSGRLEIKQQKQASIYKLGQFGAAGLERENFHAAGAAFPGKRQIRLRKSRERLALKIALSVSRFLSLQRAKGKLRDGCVNVSRSVLQKKNTHRTSAMGRSGRILGDIQPCRAVQVVDSGVPLGLQAILKSRALACTRLQQAAEQIAAFDALDTAVPPLYCCETVCCSAFRGALFA